MQKKLTLTSLFNGSGGFPLAGLLHGIEPVQCSEVEPFPIRVTTKRLPFMKHLGDISKINGAEITPTDVVTFGSPCQDMSVAGKRAGLGGERSGLFMEAIRIIKEMREATNGKYPTYIIWENVPGAYSSNNGEDFKAVLEEIVKVKDGSLSVPMPENRKWHTAGEIVGDGFSVAWRTMDAQYHGVAQRRRRIFLVADFADKRAGSILFESEGVSGNFTESGSPWQGATGSIEDSVRTAGGNSITSTLYAAYGTKWNGNAGAYNGDNFIAEPKTAIPINTQIATRHKALGERTGLGVGDNGDPAFTLQAAHSHAIATEAYSIGNGQVDALRLSEKARTLDCMHDPQAIIEPLAFEPGIASRDGGHIWEDGKTGTLRANMGDNQTAVVVPTDPLTENANGYGETGFGYWQDGIQCLRAEGENRPSRPSNVVVLNDQGGTKMGVTENVVSTLRAEEHGHQSCVLDKPMTAGFVGRQGAKAGSIGYEEEKSPTLRAGQDAHVLCEQKAFSLRKHPQIW